MKRLTFKDEYGRICASGDIVGRLAAYEDTGYIPEAIDGLKQAIFGMVAAEIGENQGIVEVPRAKEIAYAEAEGRLVVLPCKVGDVIWRRYASGLEDCHVVEIQISAGRAEVIFRFGPQLRLLAGARFEDFGKTIFLSREDAEDSMRKEMEGSDGD